MQNEKMNKKKYKYQNVTTEDLPTIVVDSPSNDKLPFADEDSESADSKTEGKDESNKNIQENQEEQRGSLRRNSISLPNLDDLQILKDKVAQISETNRSDVSINEVEEGSDDEEIRNFRSPSRNARRKSVLSPKMLRPPGDDDSNTNSITSVNSLASLFREKLQSLPQTLRKQKTQDYKTKIFVILLFMTIVILIICAYFLYQQKILQKAYFEKIKLNKAKKIMKIFNNDGGEIINARLATTLDNDQVLPCLPTDNLGDGSICLEWMFRAKLYLNFYKLGENINCYNLKWMSLADNIEPTDCFDIMTTNGHWYGGGQNAENAWPLEKGNHLFAPFITGRIEKHQWGNVLKRLFIGSKGAAILVDNKTPLYVSIVGEKSKELCLKARYDRFAFVNKPTEFPHLNYSICTGKNMKDLHKDLIKNTLWDGLKTEDFAILNKSIAEPLWEISASTKEELTDETISNFADLKENSFKVISFGHFLINEFWQEHIGDFEIDSKRFPNIDKTLTMLSRRGFSIVFTIQPFISTESPSFAEAVSEGLLVSERFSDHRIPALTRYKSLQSAGVLDITNNKTVPWLVAKLQKVLTKYKVDAFYLDFGTAYNMPHYYQCQKPLKNPDEYKSLFLSGLQGFVNIFASNSAVDNHPKAGLVALPQFESSWDGLQRVIPTILTYGVLGYPFLIQGTVGGDYEGPNSNKTDEEELYIRWLQLSTFLPVVHYDSKLSTLANSSISQMVNSLAIFRQTKIAPILNKYAHIALSTSLPIFRPLWMLDSNDPACHIVADEFAIGDELIVAPILKAGKREREVYLPAGMWKDGIDGSRRKGSRWIHDYRIPEDKIAFFEKIPDDTKFLNPVS